MQTSNKKSMAANAANKAIAAGTHRLLDVRTNIEFAEFHVPGSLHIPLDELANEHSALNPDTPLALLCLGGKRATQAAGILSEKGFRDLSVIDGGITAWQAAGLPVEKSDRNTLPLMRQVQLAIGILVLTGSLLAIFLNPLFAILPAFLGTGLTFAGASGWCGLAILLSKMPWNRTAPARTSCCIN